MTNRLYKCMCNGAPNCGCRLTNPPSYWGDEGQRHFYDDDDQESGNEGSTA